MAHKQGPYDFCMQGFLAIGSIDIFFVWFVIDVGHCEDPLSSKKGEEAMIRPQRSGHKENLMNLQHKQVWASYILSRATSLRAPSFGGVH